MEVSGYDQNRTLLSNLLLFFKTRTVLMDSSRSTALCQQIKVSLLPK